MANPSDESPPVKAVKAWLEKQGYPLEMEVAHTFIASGLGVRQGWYFEDPEDGTPREIDILAHVEMETGHPTMLQAVIECKWSQSPFVVFSYPDRSPASPSPQFMPASPVGKAVLKRLVDLGETLTLPMFGPISPLGYAVKQVPLSFLHADQRERAPDKHVDSAFEASIKLAKATFAIVDYYTHRHPTVKKAGDTIGSYTLAYIALPLLVVDAPLLDAHLDETTGIDVREVQEAFVNWSYPLLGTFPIRVCRREALGSVAHAISQSAARLAELALHPAQ